MRLWRKFLATLWRYSDTIILLGFGVYFTFLGFKGLPVDELAPIMVALLAGLAFSQLRSRFQVFDVAKTWHRARTELFRWSFPPEYHEAQTSVSHNYFFAGATMERTMPLMKTHIQRVLNNDGQVRILLPNPENDPLIDMIVAARPKKTKATIIRSIKYSLESANDLVNQGSGTLEIRTFNSPPNIGINAMDLGYPKASIMIQMYEYAPTDEGVPIFFLTSEDRPWLDHFEGQIERLWADGSPYIPRP